MLKKFLLKIINIYIYLISPFTISSCKYNPTCSNYAREAIEQHGAIKGFILSTRRVLKCHPFSKGGYDPVPEE
jgi:putative membrane protein insertion efficiency factor